MKSNSVLLVKARPATFKNTPSTPFTDAIDALPKPAERAQGLTSKWLAPAEPARSGFPAIAPNVLIAAKQNDMIVFFIFLDELEVVQINRSHYTEPFQDLLSDSWNLNMNDVSTRCDWNVSFIF